MKLRLLPLWLVVCLFSGKVWSQANNDSFAGRLTLAGANVTAVSSLQTATHEAGEPNHANYSGARSLWWTWTAPASGTVNFSTSAGTAASSFWYYTGSYTRALAIYTGSSLTALTEVANATSPSQSTPLYPSTGIPSPVASCNVQVTAGTIYQIAVDGPAFLYPGDDGTVSLAVNQSPTIYSAAGAGGTVGNAFSYTVLASNNPTSFNATGLPPGLSVNPSSGAITGTPSAAGVYTVGLAAVNPGGTNTATLTLAIVAAVSAAPSAPVIVSDAAVSGIVGASFSYYTSASGGATSYTAGNLPPGLSIDVASGLITGVPTTAGTTNVSLAATNAVGTGTATVVFNIIAAPSPPVITSALTASGTVGTSFTYYINTSYDSGSSPSAYGASNLPPGLGFDPNSYIIKGTPSTPGVYSVPITATNAGGTGTAVVTIVITAPTQTIIAPQTAAPQLSSSALATGTVGAAFSYGLTANNLPTGFTASNLPPGLSLNPFTGYLTGTPTGAGVFLVPITASNAYGTSNATLTITVSATAQTTTTSTLSPLVITSPAAASGTVGQSLSYTLNAASTSSYYSGYGALSYTASNLPPGLLLNATYGFITGTPTSAGTYSTTVTATPTASYSYSVSKGTAVITFVIGATVPPPTAAPVFTSASEVASNVGATFSGTTVFAASGSPTSYTASGLPPGLSISASSGTLSGSPTTAGTYPVTVSATNSVGTGTATVTFAVATQAATTPAVVTSSPFAVATLGASFTYSVSANVSITSCSVGTLPPGLSFNTSSNYISGTPTTLGLYQVPISVVTPSGTVNATLTINVLSAVTVPVITSAATVRSTIGSSLTYTITAQAGTNNPTTFAAGTPPPGMTYSNGTISGTPTTAGIYQVPISAANGAGTTNATVTFTITAPVAPAFTGSAVMSGTVGSAFSNSIYAYNSPTSYTASNLPPGISFSAAYFSGTPTTVGVYTVPISATNAGGTASATLTINITNPVATPPPVITSAASSAGVVGTTFSYTLTASNSPTSFDLGASTPPGLSFNATTGVLSGKPTASGVYTLPVSATNSTGTGRAVVKLSFVAQTTTAIPVITSAAATSGVVGQTFSYTLTATNSPASFALGDSLVAGLSFNPTTGVISGKPTTNSGGFFYLPVYATNASGQGSATLTMNFAAQSTPSITSPAAASALVGAPFSYTATTNASYNYGFTASSLPSGLSLNSSTGVISGTPTVAGSFVVSLSATVYSNAYTTAAAELTIIVAATPTSPPVVSSAAVVAGNVGAALSYTLAATNLPTTFGATSLPAGLTLNAATGVISGTPTAAGTANAPVSATNGVGTGSATLTIVIAAPAAIPPSLAGNTLTATATVGVKTVVYRIAATNNPTSYTASGLPPGLSLDPTSGAISGTPTDAGTYQMMVSATNAYGSASAVVALTVANATTTPSLSTSVAATLTGTVGTSFSLTSYASGNTGFTASGLPPGLTLSTATGEIFGAPTAAGSYPVTLSAVNALGSDSAIVTLLIASTPAQPPSISSGNATAAGSVGASFSYSFYPSSGATCTASGLPPGLSFTPSSGYGNVRGTPTTVGVYPVTFTLGNANGTTSAVVTITITNTPAAAPVISSAAGATATVGGAFRYQIAASNATPTGYGASGLPDGLQVNVVTGLISGTPSTVGTFPVTISAANSGGTSSAIVTLQISGTAPVTSTVPVVTSAAAVYYVNPAYPYYYYYPAAPMFAYTITASGTPTSFSTNSLPTGLSLNSYTGVISGTPATAGTFAVPISATNSAGTGSAVLTIMIPDTPPALQPALTVNTSVGSFLSYSTDYYTSAFYTVYGTADATTFTAAGLPPGLSLKSTAGDITGTPSQAGIFTTTISATSRGGTTTAIITFNVAATAPTLPPTTVLPPTFSGNAAVRGIVGAPMSFYLYGTGAGYAISGLPAGLTLDASLGKISGTPTTAGVYTVPLSTTNAGGTTNATLTISIAAVSATPIISSSAAASATVGSAFSYSIYTESSVNTATPTSYSAANLPPGLSLDVTKGYITGTPTTAGLYSVPIAASALGITGNATLTVNVLPTPATPATPTVPVFTGAAGSLGFTANPYLFVGTGGFTPDSTLPGSLVFDPIAGSIAGLLDTAGTFDLALSAANTGGTSHAVLRLRIIAPDLSLPRMISQPIGQSVQQGQSVTLSGAAVGVPTPSYQWWHDGSAVPGATTPTLTIAAAQPYDAGAYLLVASNSAGRANTTTVILSVAQTYAAWQSAYFTSEEIAAGMAGDTYDFNGDGLPNLLDYAIGRNPITALGGRLPIGSLSTTGNLQLQFTRDASKTDLSYTVEASGDLLGWTAIAQSVAGGAMVNLGGAKTVTESAAGGTLETVTVQDATSPTGTGGKHFLRLRVSRP